MKRTICLLLAAVMVLALAACGAGNANSGKQTASAYLNQTEGAAVYVTADLSGGWSMEFARGAAYLYDGEITAGKDAVAILLTLDKDVYEDHLAAAMDDQNHKEASGGVFFAYDENTTAFLTALNDSAYVLIETKDKANAEAIVARFTLELD